MSAAVTPIGTYSAHADLAPDGKIELTVFISTDPGPMRAFRPCFTAKLDDMYSLELLGTLMLARQALAAGRAA